MERVEDNHMGVCWGAKNLGRLIVPHLSCGGVFDHKSVPDPYTGYYADFSRQVQRPGHKQESQNLGSLGLGTWLTLGNTPLRSRLTLPNLIATGQTGTHPRKQIHRKNRNNRTPPFKVIDSDTKRSIPMTFS